MEFSILLRDGINTKKISLVDLARSIDDNTITAKRLSDYQNGVCTPPFVKAKKILLALGINMSDNEIVESLEENAEICRMSKSYTPNPTKKTSIRIRLRDLIPGISPEHVEVILNSRIEGLYGDGSQFSKYVNDLISKDLNEFILEEGKKWPM